MKLTKEQIADILPELQKAVQAKIDMWEAEGVIESIADEMYDGMDEALDNLAISYDRGNQVKLEDVETYFSELKED
jgi:hypothetical protein